MNPKRERAPPRPGQEGLVEATTNLVFLAAVVLIGSVVATTVVGMSLKFMEFGGEGLEGFSETGVRSPGLLAFGFTVDAANSSFDGQESADVMLAAEGETEVWRTAARDWGTGGPSGLPPDFFAVLLAGYVWCPVQVNATLHVDADGLAWVWVDNAPALSTAEPTTTLGLAPGYHALKVKYVALGGNASLGLAWNASGQMTLLGEGEVFH